MAALRGIPRILGQHSRSNCKSSLLRPAQFVCCRRIASNLFGGSNLSISVRGIPRLLVQHSPLNPKSSILRPSQLLCYRGVASKLFVGGLSFYTEENALSEAFSQFGQVIEAKIIMDRVSGRSKGFGFVTFASDDEAEKALTEMNGKVLNGRVIFVDIAKPSNARFNEGMPIARGPPEPKASLESKDED